jgi:DNA mismatch repair ATPase MutL
MFNKIYLATLLMALASCGIKTENKNAKRQGSAKSSSNNNNPEPGQDDVKPIPDEDNSNENNNNNENVNDNENANDNENGNENSNENSNSNENDNSNSNNNNNDNSPPHGEGIFQHWKNKLGAKETFYHSDFEALKLGENLIDSKELKIHRDCLPSENCKKIHCYTLEESILEFAGHEYEGTAAFKLVYKDLAGKVRCYLNPIVESFSYHESSQLQMEFCSAAALKDKDGCEVLVKK